jgi:AcrR family transcriptional regulator
MARKLPSKIASQLYAAAELIADRGLEATRMEDISEVTGIPKATLYYHLEGKNSVLEFLLADFLDLIGGAVAVAVSGGGTASERLRAAISAQISVMLEHPHLCRALVGDLNRATRLPDLAVALEAAFLSPIQHLLELGVSDGTLCPVDDPATAASSIFGAVTMTGLSVTASGRQKATASDAASLSEWVYRLLAQGVASNHEG